MTTFKLNFEDPPPSPKESFKLSCVILEIMSWFWLVLRISLNREMSQNMNINSYFLEILNRIMYFLQQHRGWENFFRVVIFVLKNNKKAYILPAWVDHWLTETKIALKKMNYIFENAYICILGSKYYILCMSVCNTKAMFCNHFNCKKCLWSWSMVAKKVLGIYFFFFFFQLLMLGSEMTDVWTI